MKTSSPGSPAIAIAISPLGEEWYCGFGPPTKDRSKAIEYVSSEVAERGVVNRFGRGDSAFHASEISTQLAARRKYAGWYYRIQPVSSPAAKAA